MISIPKVLVAFLLAAAGAQAFAPGSPATASRPAVAVPVAAADPANPVAAKDVARAAVVLASSVAQWQGRDAGYLYDGNS